MDERTKKGAANVREVPERIRGGAARLSYCAREAEDAKEVQLGSNSQGRTKPAGHEARSRCGCTPRVQRTSKSEIGEGKRSRSQRESNRVRGSGFGERSRGDETTSKSSLQGSELSYEKTLGGIVTA